MNQFFYLRAGSHSRKKRRRNERKRGRDKIPRVKRAPVVNIVGISPLRFPRNIFPLIVPLLFFRVKRIVKRHLTVGKQVVNQNPFRHKIFLTHFHFVFTSSSNSLLQYGNVFQID